MVDAWFRHSSRLGSGRLPPEVGLCLGRTLTTHQQQRDAGDGRESEELLHDVTASSGEIVTLEWPRGPPLSVPQRDLAQPSHRSRRGTRCHACRSQPRGTCSCRPTPLHLVAGRPGTRRASGSVVASPPVTFPQQPEQLVAGPDGDGSPVGGAQRQERVFGAVCAQDCVGEVRSVEASGDGVVCCGRLSFRDPVSTLLVAVGPLLFLQLGEQAAVFGVITAAGSEASTVDVTCRGVDLVDAFIADAMVGAIRESEDGGLSPSTKTSTASWPTRAIVTVLEGDSPTVRSSFRDVVAIALLTAVVWSRSSSTTAAPSVST